MSTRPLTHPRLQQRHEQYIVRCGNATICYNGRGRSNREGKRRRRQRHRRDDGPVRSTTTIFCRDRCFKDGATSDVLLMMMVGVAEMAPRGRVTSTKLLRRWISWCGRSMTEHSYTRGRLRRTDNVNLLRESNASVRKCSVKKV